MVLNNMLSWAQKVCIGRFGFLSIVYIGHIKVCGFLVRTSDRLASVGYGRLSFMAGSITLNS